VTADQERERSEEEISALLSEFKQGIALNIADSDFPTHFALGMAFAEMGLHTDAIAEFQKVLQFRPSHIEARTGLLVSRIKLEPPRSKPRSEVS
jgi:hypothetical protein